MDATYLGINLIGVRLAEAASNMRKMTSSCLELLGYPDFMEAPETVDVVRRRLKNFVTLVAAVAVVFHAIQSTEDALLSDNLADDEHLLAVAFVCFNKLVFTASLMIISWRLPAATMACHGHLLACTVAAQIGHMGAFAILYSRSLTTSICLSALVAPVLLCIGLQVLAYLRKPVGNWDYHSQETLPKCSKHWETAESEDHRDPALSDPQESVPKWLNKFIELRANKDQDMKWETEKEHNRPKWRNNLFELPADKDEGMKWKTEKGDKYLMILAVLAASLTYQAVLNPSGGLWQESNADHVIGNPVLSDNHQHRYMAFFYCNATAFFSSLAIILLLLTRKLFASAIHTNTLSMFVILDMIGLTGAFAAVSSRRAAECMYAFILLIAVIVYIALQVLVRVDSGSHSEHSVLRRNPRNLATLDLLPGLIVVNGAGNRSESADPAVDDEDDANRPIQGSPREATWRVASAAPHHMTGNQSLLFTSNYNPLHDGNEGVFVNLANREAVPLQVRGSGSVRTENITLDDVWYVPGLDSNLVSSGQLARQGCAINLGRSGGRITRGGTLVGTARFTDACQFELDFLKVDASM